MIRSRTTGVVLIGVMMFLIFGILFVVPDEPTQIQIQANNPDTPEDEEIVIDIPTVEQIFDLQVPIPEFDIPIILEVTPVITTTDSLGIDDVKRGETFILTGLEIIQVGVPDKTFDNGKFKIELEFDTGNIFPMEIFVVKPSMDIILNDQQIVSFVVPPKSSQGNDVISVIGVETSTPDCTLQLPCIVGTTTNGIFTVNIFESPINPLELNQFIKSDFILTQLDVNIAEDIAVGLFLPETPMPSLPLNGDIDIGFLAGEDPESVLDEKPDPDFSTIIETILPEDSQPIRIEPVNFKLLEPIEIYSVTFGNVELFTELIEEDLNATEVIIVEQIVEDVPDQPCPDVKFDSISFLTPTVEVSGTTSFWTGTPEGLDQNSVDVRNNRNCDLDIALGSKWISATGDVFISDLEDITILTNTTIPFKSIVFDSLDGCGGFACAGLKVSICFIGQVSTTDPIEIIDDFCGNKFFR